MRSTTVFLLGQGLGSLTLPALLLGGACSHERLTLLVGTFEATPLALDFGLVAVGSQTPRTVRLRAGGTRGVLVEDVSTTSGNPAFVFDPTPLALRSGQTFDFSVVYEPTAAGDDSDTLLIETDADQGATQEVTLTGTAYDPCVDNDADLYGLNCTPGPDCNDDDPTVSPGAAERCNGADDNCDNVPDEGFPVGEACSAVFQQPDDTSCTLDGQYVCASDGNGVVCLLDDSQEVCDGVDNNCNGTVDDPFPQVGEPCYVPESSCTRPGTFECSIDGTEARCVPDMSQPLQCCQPGQVQNGVGVCCSPLPAGACTYSCTVDVVNGTHDCAAPVTGITLAPGSGIATLDMTGRGGVEISIALCDPTGFTFHVADSPTCNGGGGDASTFNNDAEAHFNNIGDFFVIGNDYSPAAARVLANLPGFAPAGCSANTFWVADQRFLSFEPCVDLSSQYLLRVDPPADGEGAPDALWYLGFNQVHDGAYRPGTGLTQVSLCFR